MAPPTLTAHLYNTANSSFVADLADSFGRLWQDPLSELGGGTISLGYGDTNISACTIGRHIRFLLDGVPAYTWRIDKRENTLVADGEEVRQGLKLTGKGHLAEWGEAVVYPLGGIDSRPASDMRPFSWASKEYSDAGWGGSYQIYPDAHFPQSILTTQQWPPLGWPAPVNSSSVRWIYSRSPVPVHPVGYTFYRTTLTISTTGTYCFYLAADDRARMFLNGIELIDWTDSYPKWSTGETHSCSLKVTSGTHVLGVQVENYDFAGDVNYPWYIGSSGAFLAAVHSRPNSAGFSASTLVLGSTPSWKSLDYPTVVPAPTPGVILSTLLAEAQVRGVLTGWSLSCSATVDSNGDPWTTPSEFACRVGDSYLSVLKALADQAIDFRASPGSKILDVYNKGAVTGTGPTLVIGSNIRELTHTSEAN